MKNLMCLRCKIHMHRYKLETPGLMFNWLKGTPWLCERCLAGLLGIENPEWNALFDDLYGGLNESYS